MTIERDRQETCREEIDRAFQQAESQAKQARALKADERKAQRAAAVQQRDQEIARLLAGCAPGSMLDQRVVSDLMACARLAVTRHASARSRQSSATCSTQLPCSRGISRLLACWQGKHCSQLLCCTRLGGYVQLQVSVCSAGLLCSTALCGVV